jgi:hypothetical protein
MLCIDSDSWFFSHICHGLTFLSVYSSTLILQFFLDAPKFIRLYNCWE